MGFVRFLVHDNLGGNQLSKEKSSNLKTADESSVSYGKMDTAYMYTDVLRHQTVNFICI